MRQFGWAVSAVMVLAAVGLVIYAVSLLTRHGPLLLAIINLGIAVLCAFLAARVFASWRRLRAHAQ